ncbi:tyrosine-protein phosphatase, partial [Nocardia abscessus]
MRGQAGGHSVLFHCAAGKDRTGVLAAVLLDAVGVPPEAIAVDYALTG